jgi:FlaA1/EpsC-like NDP-sugar epimerase
MDASYQLDHFSPRPTPPFRIVRLLIRTTQFGMDLLVLTSAFTLAYLVRFDFQIPLAERPHLFTQLVPVVLIQFVLLNLTGVYAFIWRYVGMAEFKAFFRAAIYSAIPILIGRLFLPETYQAFRVPFSVALMDSVLAFGGVVGLRVLRRNLYESGEKRHHAITKEKR